LNEYLFLYERHIAILKYYLQIIEEGDHGDGGILKCSYFHRQD